MVRKYRYLYSCQRLLSRVLRTSVRISATLQLLSILHSLLISAPSRYIGGRFARYSKRFADANSGKHMGKVPYDIKSVFLTRTSMVVFYAPDAPLRPRYPITPAFLSPQSEYTWQLDTRESCRSTPYLSVPGGDSLSNYTLPSWRIPQFSRRTGSGRHPRLHRGDIPP